MRRKLVCVSGYFDPVHSGHLDYMEAAAKYGDLVVILNSDEAAKRKKGYVFQKFEERKRIIESLKFVYKVVPVDDADGTVIKALRDIRPDFFCNGGDRVEGNTPEKEVCEAFGITMLWGIGGENKANSSSKLVAESWDSLLGNLG